MIDLERLEDFDVASVVVHYVPTKRDDPDGEMLLTEDEIDLAGGLRTYFRDKIVTRLEAKGLEVVRDPDGSPCVEDAVAAVQAGQGSLVAASRGIATHLDEIQTANNSSGLLAVIKGHIAGSTCLAILKLERERGVRFAIDTIDGRHVVDLELLRNLTLTDKTKVYKTALLAPTGGGGIKGLVADDQRGTVAGRPVARFFLSKFLGCKPAVPAAQTTFDFVVAANAAFNEDVASPEQKGRYQVALLAEMQSSVADLTPAGFAHRHLEPDHRPLFLERVRVAGIDPQRAFAKDTTLVKVSRFKMTFESGMVLVGDRESLEHKVEIPEGQDSDEPVKLRDTIANLLTGR